MSSDTSGPTTSTPLLAASGSTSSRASGGGFASECAARRAVQKRAWACAAVLPLFVMALFVAGGVFDGRLGRGDEGAGKAGPAAGEGLSFMVVGDWGRDGAKGQAKVAGAMAKVARRLGVRFVVSSGDNFYDAGVEGVEDGRWRRSFEDIYRDGSLRDVAWWITLGNHDHLGSIEAQVKYSGVSRRWTMPSPYYTFTAVGGGGETSAADVQFVFLDSTPYTHDAYGKAARKIGKQVPSAQTAWLKKTLEESVAPYIVVVVHHCMYTMSMTGHLGTPELRAHVEPLLLRHRARVLAVITGHEHALMHMQPYGGAGVWAGAAASVPPENATEASARGHRHAADPARVEGAPGYDRVFRYGEEVEGEGLGEWEGRVRQDGGGREDGEGRMQPPGMADHFISGGGSALDAISVPSGDKAGVWEACCGVLTSEAPETRPRGLWAESQRGFFVFTITHDTFWAVAYNDKGRQIYVYSKPI